MAQTRRYCLRLRPFDLMPTKPPHLLDISSIYIAPLSLFISRAVRGSCAYLPLSLAFAMPIFLSRIHRYPPRVYFLVLRRVGILRYSINTLVYPPVVTSYRRGR